MVCECIEVPVAQLNVFDSFADGLHHTLLNSIDIHVAALCHVLLLVKLLHLINKLDHHFDEFGELLLLLEGEDLLLQVEYLALDRRHSGVCFRFVDVLHLLFDIVLEVIKGSFGVANQVMLCKELESEVSLYEYFVVTEIFSVLVSRLLSLLHLSVCEVHDLVLCLDLETCEDGVLLVVEGVFQILTDNALHLLKNLQQIS